MSPHTNKSKSADPLAGGPPGALGSDKRKKPAAAAPAAVAEDWTPTERAATPWGLIGIIIFIIVVVIIAAALMKGGKSTTTGEGEVSTAPATTSTAQAEPGFKQVDRKSLFISVGNQQFYTEIVAQPGDRVTISVDSWSDTGAPPPLIARIGDGPDIQIGAGKTFTADSRGKLYLTYQADTVVPPEGNDKFVVHILVEIPEI